METVFILTPCAAALFGAVFFNEFNKTDALYQTSVFFAIYAFLTSRERGCDINRTVLAFCAALQFRAADNLHRLIYFTRHTAAAFYDDKRDGISPVSCVSPFFLNYYAAMCKLRRA